MNIKNLVETQEIAVAIPAMSGSVHCVYFCSFSATKTSHICTYIRNLGL